MLRWLLFDNHKFTSYIATHRFMTHFMKQDNEVTKFFKGRAEGALKIVDKHLAGKEWMTLGRPTIADLSMAGYMYYDGELGFDFADLSGARRLARAHPRAAAAGKGPTSSCRARPGSRTPAPGRA